MPDMSNIDSEKMTAAAGQLEGIADRMNGCVNKFCEAIGILDKGWVSEVKTEFMASFQKDSDAMQEMLSQVREISTGLRESAKEFEQTENDTLSKVNGLG